METYEIIACINGRIETVQSFKELEDAMRHARKMKTWGVIKDGDWLNIEHVTRKTVKYDGDI